MTISNDELQMVRETAVRLVREATAAGVGPARDMDATTWDAAVDSGWSALAIPEAAGGLGGGAAELCVLAEELGRGLMVGRFLVDDVLAGQWLAAAPAGERRDALLEVLLGGSRELAVADAEPQDRGAPGRVRLRARRVDSGWVLEGDKARAWRHADTRALLVSARDAAAVDVGSTGAASAAGQATGAVLLFEVPLDATGLQVRDYGTVDGGRALDVAFRGVRVDAAALLAGKGAGFAAARLRAWDLALLATCAECVGLMQSLQQRTAEYLASRKQFGQPLAKLQVLRHRLADMALARLRAEALVAFAIPRLDLLDDAGRAQLVAATVSKALSGARFVAEQAVQLHGGMGVSEELPIGRFLRRVLALEATLGTPDFHRGRFEVQ